MAYIESGEKEGAKIVTGGKRWPESGGGYWVEPTILVDVKPDMKVVKEEVRPLPAAQMILRNHC